MRARRMLGFLAAAALLVLLGHSASAATVDGLKLQSSSVGTGPTIVFVHGWTCDSSSWTSQVPAFSKDHRVITLDLPGHGQSASPQDGKLSMDLFARAVEAVRAEAGADRIVLVGHSMGAPVIRQYAHLYPQHVAGLVAVDGPLDIRVFPAELPPGFAASFTGPEGRAAREGMIKSMFIAETPAALQDHILKMMLAAPEATAVGAMNATFDPANRWTDVIQAPALTVYAGTANVPDPVATKELYPNHEATQLKGTGHFLMMEKPAEFNRLLAGFLDKIDF
ncbi:MAG TPA: alpha/beta hydrolase [Gammaproteobacteria bacterium]|nr:alpha/beta hydrolase [Gammaproteobacteria bacterium]